MEYSIINGKKYKKCKEGEIRNPLTKRCNKIKNQLNKHKQIEYSIINGKKYKKCKEGEIRNLITKRCNKIKIIKKPNLKPFSVDKKNTKIKKLFLPFINRVSANISDRIRYYFLIKKQLNLGIKNNKGCLKIYKVIDNKPIYRIGNNIIVKNKIGTDSENGIVFLSTFRDKNKKLFKYTCKITKLSKDSKLDLEIQKILLKSVAKCPHFPIIYGSLECTNFMSYKDSFIKSKSSDKTVKQDLALYPKIMKRGVAKTFLITFNELANGDLKMFVNADKLDKKEIFNSYVQIFMALIFYYKTTGLFHCDSHWGNFLYHKIKPGGYFHYKIFNKDYYIENLGYLWIIWDFELSRSYKKTININGDEIYLDLVRYINAYNIDPFGWNKNPVLKNNLLLTSQIKEFNKKLNFIYRKQYENLYQYNNLNNLIKEVIALYVDNNILLEDIPDKSLIINKSPYEFNGKYNQVSL